MSHFRSDNPVRKFEDDVLNRYPFAERIAYKIMSSKQGDSIVIGIYGEWGTGKTTVVNFIKEELSSDDRFVSIDFNPWRFPDEKTLLQNFFIAISKSLDISSNPEDESGFVKKKKRRKKKGKSLLTTGEKIAEEVSKYGKLLSFLNTGEGIDAFSDLTSPDVLTLKKRLEELIIDSKKKLVIFIDDIDRLDKDEIHAIFRLVKLNADFSNTCYVLAFDSDMVASSIGERFGEGMKQAGMNFIEKIIQVPLNLPVAQPNILSRYTLELLNKILDENDIAISEDDTRRFNSEFAGSIMLRLTSIRLVIRYINSISFIIPMLKGEINIIDLLFLEALRIFYSEYYDFLKNNETYFVHATGGFDQIDLEGDLDQIENEIESQIDDIGKKLPVNVRYSARSLLNTLFPKINTKSINSENQLHVKTWETDKRVVIPRYLSTYFSMSVMDGEISDVSFEKLISSTLDLTEAEFLNEMKKIVNNASADSFLRKISAYEGSLDWAQTQLIVRSIGKLGKTFPRTEAFVPFGIGSPDRQAAFFIYRSLKLYREEPDCYTLAKDLMNSAQPFEFAYEINNALRTGSTPEEQIFSKEQYLELAKELINRALEESSENPIFERFSNYVGYLYYNWNVIDREGVIAYTEGILNKNPEKIKDLIIAFTPMAISSGYPKPYKSTFSNEQYNFLTGIFDKEYLHNLLIEQYGEEIAQNDPTWHDNRNDQSGINILRQFNHWYNQEIKFRNKDNQ